MLQRGKRSIVPVHGGVCSACHLRLPIGHLTRLQSSQDLEVCDNCGTFIYFERTNETLVLADSKPARAEGKHMKGAVR
jgi:predicted  nucleic acid-binding Zn-ribbon protein